MLTDGLGGIFFVHCGLRECDIHSILFYTVTKTDLQQGYFELARVFACYYLNWYLKNVSIRKNGMERGSAAPKYCFFFCTRVKKI